MTEPLLTERLVLRPLVADDAATTSAAESPDVVHSLVFLNG